MNTMMSRSRSVGALALVVALLAALFVPNPAFARAAPVGETARAGARNASTGTAQVGWLELSGPLRDGPLPFAWVTPAEAGPSLYDVVRQIEHVGSSADHQGLVIYLDQPPLSLTQVHTLRDAIQRCRDAGKTVIAFAEVYTTRDYLLASAADLVVLQHKGGVALDGISVEEMYLAGMFEKLGVKADFVQVGDFKGAAEALVNQQPSEPWNRNFDALLDGLYAQMVGPLAASRGWTMEQAEDLMLRSMTMTDTDLLTAGVVDRLSDRDLTDVTEAEFGGDFAWDDAMGFASGPGLALDNPFAIFSLLFKQQNVTTRRDTIAIVRGYGPITSGDSTIGDGQFSSDSIGSRTFGRALNAALNDQNVKGVVIRIDSPGGSALASEVIWQAVREVRAEKPVYVSVGDMAASGGYYIASGGDKVYVEPASILGSIGVVGGKFVLGGLYDWAGINVVRRGRGPHADLFNSVEPFTDEQREMVRTSMVQVYDQFLQRVKLGRGDRIPDLDAVDEGMLFTGAQCVENGLADKVGGLRQAVEDLAAELKLTQGQYDVINLPPAISLQEYLQTVFGGTVSAPRVNAPSLAAVVHAPQNAALVQTARALLGEAAWAQVRETLLGLSLLQREPVLLMSPAVLIVR